MALGKKSKQNLSTCHTNLRKLVRHAAAAIDKEKKRRKGSFKFDFTVRDGYRGEKEQNEAFEKKNSKLRFPKSKHNRKPSQAVHLLPYPVRWPQKPGFPYLADSGMTEYWMEKEKYEKELKIYVKQLGRFYQLHGFMLAASVELDIPMRWGGDWNRDGNILDQSFDDLGHYEVVLD